MDNNIEFAQKLYQTIIEPFIIDQLDNSTKLLIYSNEDNFINWYIRSQKYDNYEENDNNNNL